MPNKNNELGNDGAVTFANQYTGIDAYSIQLHYNSNDYTAILNTCYCVSNSITIPATHTVRNLYNGNITGMSVSIPKLNKYPVANPTTHFGSMYYNYKYDQLNRIKEMDTYTRMLVSSNAIIYSTALNDYKERIKYDANGNILKYQRHGNLYSSVTGAANLPLTMDSLEYKYYAGTNQLRQVKDTINPTSYLDDIDTQADTSNYRYDAIGNLVKDKHEGIDTILWNVYGKISEIQKGTDTTIRYTYDAGGNRISKTVILPSAGGGADTTVTWYVRDATGNVMSVYKIHNDTTYQDELHLYGSSRIGILKPERYRFNELDVQYGDTSGTLSLVGAWKVGVFRRGMKFFELANHLGNVLVTISDKKNGYDAAGDGNVDYYKPVVMSANDYYPFGMLMPGRKYTSSSTYRYGYNGKELDKDISADAYDYGMRISDQRLGKFLSVDPIAKQYPQLTPYQYASNSPIAAIDMDGLEGFVSISGNHMPGPTFRVQFDVDGDHIPDYNEGYAAGLLGTAVGGFTVLTLGRAGPLLKKAGIGSALWASRPENQQRLSDAFIFGAELFNPDPAPLNPGNPSSQLGSDVKQVTKKLLTVIKPILERRKELAKAWGVAEKYIEFSKQVYKTEIKEGTDLIQYRVTGTEGTIGNYYALPGTKPEAIGINPDDVVETLQIKVKTSTSAIISTHKKDIPYYKDASVTLKGGGLQVYSKELKNNVEVINTKKANGID